MDFMKNFIEQITKEIEEKETCKINVSIECESIHLRNMHDLEITNVTETDTEIALSTTYGLDFTIGKNYIDIIYIEPDNDYIFKYVNDMEIRIAVL